jgi:tetratricopeptide (TPR) repeat protein
MHREHRAAGRERVSTARPIATSPRHAACAALAAWFWCAPASPPAHAQEAARYLVIPFENVKREARLYWLTEGSAVLLTDDLLALGASAITRDDRLRAFESLNVPPVATLSHATVIRLGQLVGASHVVVGAFEQNADVLRVKARSIRLDTGRIQPEVSVEGPLAQMLNIYARIARQLTGATAATVEQIEKGQPPLAAFEQYIKGVLAESPATKLGYLQEAVEIHPPFQRARLAQWEVYTDQGEHQQALGVARQVPADLPYGRYARFLAATSLISLRQYDEAFAALTELNRVKADPAVLNNLGIVQLRRKATLPRAAHYFSEASKLDPEDPDLFFNLGYAYFADGDAKSAAHWLRESVRRDPTDDEAHYALGVALEAAGGGAEAAREKELARQLSSQWAEREKKHAATLMPPDLERLKSALVEPGALRVESVIVASEQREQQELAAFHLDRGRRMFQQERHGEAIAELRRAIYLMPYQADAHFLLARAYQSAGRLREAIDSLKIAVWIDPANQEAQALLKKLTAGV